EPAAAAADFRAARHLAPHCVAPMVGVALWQAGELQAACEDWANEIGRIRSGEVTHYDETGNVAPLLWWASMHDVLASWRELATEELRRLARGRRRWAGAWPGAIALLLLGELSSDEFLAAAASRYPTTEARQHCQAQFYLGAIALSRGTPDRYRQHLERAIT